MKNNRDNTANPAQVTDGPISQQEMVVLFGSEIPIEAVNLLYECPDDWTASDLRRKLREIAAIGAGGQAVAWMRKWAFDGIDVMAKPKKDRPAGWMLYEVTRHHCLPDDVPLYTHPDRRRR